MTRIARTDDEKWAIDLLLNSLAAESSEWIEPDGSLTDRPDLVLSGPGGLCVACEITRVGRSEWFRWQNDRGLQLDVNELDEMNLPREVDLWLANAIASKAPHAPNYIGNASASEAWLLVHGGLNKVHDFFVLNDEERYDIPLLVEAAKTIKHPFQRIYVASISSNRIICVFPYRGVFNSAPDITRESILRVLSIRSLQIQTTRGVNYVPIGREYSPHRVRMLPPLDSGRLKP